MADYTFKAKELLSVKQYNGFDFIVKYLIFKREYYLQLFSTLLGFQGKS